MGPRLPIADHLEDSWHSRPRRSAVDSDVPWTISSAAPDYNMTQHVVHMSDISYGYTGALKSYHRVATDGGEATSRARCL
jgi:hypothetical protein